LTNVDPLEDVDLLDENVLVVLVERTADPLAMPSLTLMSGTCRICYVP